MDFGGDAVLDRAVVDMHVFSTAMRAMQHLMALKRQAPVVIIKGGNLSAAAGPGIWLKEVHALALAAAKAKPGSGSGSVPMPIVTVVATLVPSDRLPVWLRPLVDAKRVALGGGPSSPMCTLLHRRVSHLVGDCIPCVSACNPATDRAAAVQWLQGCIPPSEPPVQLVVCVPEVHTWTIGEVARFLGWVRQGLEDLPSGTNISFAGLLLQGWMGVLPCVLRKRGMVPSAQPLLQYRRALGWPGVARKHPKCVKEVYEDRAIVSSDCLLQEWQRVVTKAGSLTASLSASALLHGVAWEKSMFNVDAFAHIGRPPPTLAPEGMYLPCKPNLIRGDIIHHLTKATAGSAFVLHPLLRGRPFECATVLWRFDPEERAFQVQALRGFMLKHSKVLCGEGGSPSIAVAAAGAVEAPPKPDALAALLKAGAGAGAGASSHPVSVDDTFSVETCGDDAMDSELGSLLEEEEEEEEPVLPFRGPGVVKAAFMTDAELRALGPRGATWFKAVEPGCPIVIDHPTTLLEYALTAQGRAVTIVVFGKHAEFTRVNNALKQAADVTKKWCSDVGIHCMAFDTECGAWVNTQASKEDVRRGKTANGRPLGLVLTPDQVCFAVDFLVCVVEPGFSVDTMALSSLMQSSTLGPRACMAAQMSHLLEHVNPFATVVILAEGLQDVAGVFLPRVITREEHREQVGPATTVSFAVDVAIAMEAIMDRKEE